MVPDENLEHTSGNGILNRHLCICMKMYENILHMDNGKQYTLNSFNIIQLYSIK